MKRLIIKEKIMKKTGVLILAVALIATMGARCATVVKAESKDYISVIVLKAGDDGNKKLTDKGYNVLSPSLVTNNGKKIWLGYKTTTNAKNAIRDIVADTSSAGSGYKKAKTGTVVMDEGKKAYLFTTKDSKAGEPILAISLLSSDTNAGAKFKSVMPVANNGSVVVRNASNNPVVFKNSNGKTYLNIIKKDVWKNYISGIKVFEGTTKKEAVEKLAKAGYDFYIDKNYGTKKGYKIISLSKTNNEDKAITDVLGLSDNNIKISGYKLVSQVKIAGKYLYVTSNKKVGNPITNIDGLSELNNMEISARQWTGNVVAGGANQIARPYIAQQSEYIKMSESNAKYILRNASCDDQTDLKVTITTAKKNLSKKLTYKQKLLTRALKKNIVVNTDTEDGNSDSNIADNNNQSPKAIAKKTLPKKDQEENSEAIQEELTQEEQGVEVATGINDGEGTIISPVDDDMVPITEIVVLGAIALMIPIVTIFVRKKMKSKK